jgi:hypothetical protein
MDSTRRRVGVGFLFALAVVLVLPAHGQWAVRNTSYDQPLVLDQYEDYLLENVSITGLRDQSAVTLTGRIRSVRLDHCVLGNIRAGENNKATALDCVGASVNLLQAEDSIFFDAEHCLASLREGSFSLVRFQRCSFRTSDSFLAELYSANPWRNTPPTAEFYNIDRLELIDSAFSNVQVVIHPSVKKVIIRGSIPSLLVEDPEATHVIHLDPHEVPDPALASAT